MVLISPTFDVLRGPFFFINSNAVFFVTLYVVHVLLKNWTIWLHVATYHIITIVLKVIFLT